jgi:hypothetical protein
LQLPHRQPVRKRGFCRPTNMWLVVDGYAAENPRVSINIFCHGNDPMVT